MHTEFAALLARAGVSQAAFARLAGLSPRQVNNWARGRLSANLGRLNRRHPAGSFAEALTIMLEETAAGSLNEANTGKPPAPGLAGQCPH
jgi:transcriptional regulator with XRE-family HTH domain